MLAALAAALLLGQGGAAEHEAIFLGNPNGGTSKLMMRVPLARLEPPKLSPRKFPPGDNHWEFDWQTLGYGIPEKFDGNFHLRFRVFSQEKRSENDPAPLVARMGLRMWDLLHRRLLADHPMTWQGLNLVDFYLCWGGEAGAEQKIEEDATMGEPMMLNVIYIYDLRSFKAGIEMAREVAHEYGHAVLPAVGGFETPEDWANGYLGEKLFLKLLRDEMAADRVGPNDVMATSFPSLDAWVKANVDPLVKVAATTAPDRKLLASKGKKAMDSYLGLAMYAEALLPPSAFSRSLRLTGSQNAYDYPNALVGVIEEAKELTLRVPPGLSGKPLWIPLGQAQVSGAKILGRGGNWAKVQPTGPTFTVKSPKAG